MLLSFANCTELVSALICTMCLIHKPSVLNRWFVLFLWTTVVVELMGKLTVSMLHLKIPMYNLFNGVEFFFYLALLSMIVNRKNIKMLLWGFFILFGIFFLINLMFGQGLYVYNNHTHTAGAILLIGAALLVFFRIMISDTNDLGWLKWPLLWVLLAIMIFYTGNIFNTALYNRQSEINPDRAVWLYKLINHNLNVVLYSFFSIALILEVRRSKYLITPG